MRLRWTAALATVSVLATPIAWARDLARPVDLQGAPFTVKPPIGEQWSRRVDTDVPGQWVLTMQRGDLAMQAAVFPARDNAPDDPRKVLSIVMRRTLPTIGVTGPVGMPTLERLTVLGYTGARATLSVRRSGRIHGGLVRLVRTGGTWCMTWGVFPSGVAADVRADVEDFVASLTPKAPSFFTPRFFDERRLTNVLFRPTGENAIRVEHIIAMERLLEVAFEGPLTLGRKEQLRSVILDRARQADRTYRDGIREAPKAFERLAGMNEAQQRAAQAKLAESLHHGFLSLYVARDDVGVRYMHVWRSVHNVVAGRPPNALRARHLDALLEMLGFLASLAADAPREVTPEQRLAFYEARAKAWDDADAELRAGWLAAADDWLRLRCAWDRATDTQRNDYRRAVLRTFLPPDKVPAFNAVSGDHALKQWVDAHGPLDMNKMMERAAAMTQAARHKLLKVLPTWPDSVPLGW